MSAFLSKITKKLVKNQWDTPKQFMPVSKLGLLVTDKHINLYFTHCPVAPDVANYILTRAKRTFLISVLVLEHADEVKRAMEMLMVANLDDRVLPIDPPPDEEGRSQLSGNITDCDGWSSDSDDEELDDEEADIIGKGSKSTSQEGCQKAIQTDPPGGTKDVEVNLHVFQAADRNIKVWTINKIRLFCQDQWKFLAPVVTTGKPTQTLESDAILPFLRREDCPAAGGFSKVYGVVIADGHFEDPEGTMGDYSNGQLFAIKAMNPGPDDKMKKEVRENWVKEARTLYKLNKLQSPHIVKFITAFRRESAASDDYYLMMEWADGGSLRDRWKKNPQPDLTKETIRDTLYQFRGLAEALARAHVTRLDGALGSIRHGDLKPENILWFPKEGDFGTLKIGDWGLAKEHFLATHVRTKGTSTRHGTLQYEPPEMVTEKGPKIVSRLYDMWSLGCIFLEYLIWLLYGWNELKKFNKAITSNTATNVPFYEINSETGKAKVHRVVARWLGHMAKQPASRGNTALQNMLSIIEKNLLVVEYDKRAYTRPLLKGRLGRGGVGVGVGATLRPPQMAEGDFSYPSSDDGEDPDLHPSPPTEQQKVQIPILAVTPTDDDILQEAAGAPNGKPEQVEFNKVGRIRADDLRSLLDKLLDNEDGSFWDPSNTPRVGPSEVTSVGGKDYLSSDSSERREHVASRPQSLAPVNGTPLALRAAGPNQPENPRVWEEMRLPEMPKGGVNYAHPPLTEDWEVDVDNDFANHTMAEMTKLPVPVLLLPDQQKPLSLCTTCAKLEPWADLFSATYSIEELKERSAWCRLCEILWTSCRRVKADSIATVQFERTKDSWLTISTAQPRQTSISKLAFPDLLEPGSDMYFEILRQWVHQCNDPFTHPLCNQGTSQPDEVRLPTRLLDVGEADAAQVRLMFTRRLDKHTTKYVALSHPWGVGKHFCTYPTNAEQHMHDGLVVVDLPATFRDAVVTTRALGLRYLWIDSLCIVQGPGGDFDGESKHMAAVFSQAHVVLAASRARNHFDGFLQKRRPRRNVALVGPRNEQFYVCENIDDFENDVLQGDLNRRGWVLQEHALARRTIFFTDSQTYWECGNGVRCETMTRMRNNAASFLGDPNFPQIMTPASRGERIVRFQDLYAKYSQLAFTNSADRPIAIDGLEDRLIRAFEDHTKGGFGVFYDGVAGGFLHRSLLWHRAGPDETALRPIVFPAGHGAGAAAVKPPSWSWMAYTGAIGYKDLSPPFNEVEWDEIESPWTSAAEKQKRTSEEGVSIAGGDRGGRGYQGQVSLLRGVNTVSNATVDRTAAYSLRCKVRNLNMPSLPGAAGAKLILDAPGGSEKAALECVVVAVKKASFPREAMESRAHWVMVLRKEARGSNTRSLPVYKRIGVAEVLGTCIHKETTDALIQ